MKNNIKYYLDRLDTEKKYFNHWPFWVSGNDYDYGKEYYTDNILEADFICVYFPNLHIQNSNLEIIEKIKIIKEKNSRIKLIIINKEELLFDYTYKFIKDLREQFVFEKNEIIVSTPNINVIENNLYTHFPAKLWCAPLFSRWRNIINIKMIDELKSFNIKKNKKLIASSRKYNLFRDFFYNKISKNIESYDDDITLRYYGMVPADDLKNFYKLKEIFKKNNEYDLVSSELMDWNTYKFYIELQKDYSNHYFSIVGETFPFTTTIYNSYDEFQMSEKTLIPMLTKNIFFTNHKTGFENKMVKLGIESFEGMFGIYYDILSPEYRIQNLIKIVNLINSLSYSEIEEIYNSNEIQQKLENNYNYILFWANEENQKIEYENFLNQIL